MININRPLQSPASLQTQSVKDYLDELADWKTDYADKLMAHQANPNLPKPSSKFDSQKKPSYRKSDLIDIFDEYFFAKCYLTEKTFVSSYEMDVEHFVPKNEHPELRYEWTNLFPADHDANMSKPNATPLGGYLDPCNPNDDVEKGLFYRLDYSGQACYFDSKDKTNIKALNTAKLLDRIHNGHDRESKLKTQGLRKGLFDKRDEVQKTIMSWLSAKHKGDNDEEWHQECKLRNFLSKKSSYTMLIRSISAVRLYVPPEFLD